MGTVGEECDGLAVTSSSVRLSACGGVLRDGSVVRSVARSLRRGVWRGVCAAGKPLLWICFPVPTNFARNSLATASNIELWSLELQRFWMLLNVHAVELRASFVWLWLWRGCCRPIGGLRAGRRWGFCTTRSPLTACRRVGPLCSAIPPVSVSSSNFACNSPERSCSSVSVRVAVSLVFWNCMRLCIARGA